MRNREVGFDFGKVVGGKEGCVLGRKSSKSRTAASKSETV
jgi:hypothetical protein